MGDMLTAITVEPAVELRMLSQPMYLAGAREMVTGLARRLGFRDDAAGQIALAVDEALANVINHGYQRRADGPIWMKLWPQTDQGHKGICIVIEDEARQVEPSTICGRDLADIKPGGLGVHIIRQIMDTVVYEKRTPLGMRLTMVKALSERAPTEPSQPAEAARPGG
jgi:anti-sigma regulatory factor (Ser/Thr protein kinase)